MLSIIQSIFFKQAEVLIITADAKGVHAHFKCLF